MNNKKKILSIGIILLITGMIASVISFAPSRLLQYLFIVTSAAVGVFGILIGKNKNTGSVRSTYYSWIGFILIGLAIALAIWATSLMAFVNVLGFFLVLLGMVEFVFALQILNYETPVPWSIVGLKLMLSAATAVSAALILTVAGVDIYGALLLLGLLVAAAGLTFIRISSLIDLHQSSTNRKAIDSPLFS